MSEPLADAPVSVLHCGKVLGKVKTLAGDLLEVLCEKSPGHLDDPTDDGLCIGSTTFLE